MGTRVNKKRLGCIFLETSCSLIMVVWSALFWSRALNDGFHDEATRHSAIHSHESTIQTFTSLFQAKQPIQTGKQNTTPNCGNEECDFVHCPEGSLQMNPHVGHHVIASLDVSTVTQARGAHQRGGEVSSRPFDSTLGQELDKR